MGADRNYSAVVAQSWAGNDSVSLFILSAAPAALPPMQGHLSPVRSEFGSGQFCGGSCSPANLWWEKAAALYQIQLKLPSTFSEKKQQGIMTAVANSAILAGPR